MICTLDSPALRLANACERPSVAEWVIAASAERIDTERGFHQMMSSCAARQVGLNEIRFKKGYFCDRTLRNVVPEVL